MTKKAKTDKTIGEILGQEKIRESIRRAILEVVREVPDAYGVLSNEEKERLDRRADSMALEVEELIASKAAGVFERALAGDRPYFVFTRGNIKISDENKLTVVLSGPLADFPREAFAHRGLVHCQLIERQGDLIEEINSAQPDLLSEGQG